MAKSSFFGGTGISAENTTALESSTAAAAASETAAAASATSAASSAASASSNVSTNAASAAASEVSRQAALAAKNAAETAETNAETAENNAETAETNSGNSATASANSATASANSATASEASKVTSGNSAAASANSATASEASKVTSTSKAADAETARAAAVVAKDAAAVSATNAANSVSASLPKAGGAMSGAITTNSTFDGRDVATDGAKLDGIASGATADQTSAQIKTSYESNANTQAFTDADHTKLDGIEANATADQTGAQIKSAYQAETNAFTDAQFTKLSGIEASATADQTPAQLLTAIKTVDGAGTGLDADLLDGQQGSYFTGYTDTAVSNLVDSSPAALNTLNELAAALGDDVNFSTTVTNSIATKAALSGAAFTGAITTNSTVDGVDIATRDAVLTSTTTTANAALSKSGGTMTGPLIVGETTAVTMSKGTTAQRPTGVAGMFRYNTQDERFEGYSNSWGEIGGGAADLRVNSFTGNGSTTAYTLTTSPDLSNTLVYIDGIYQVKAAYSISGQVLTLSAAPDNGALIEITAATVAPVQESTDFLINNFTGNNSTTAFTLSAAPTNENQCSVFISGVYQSKANFSVSGSTLTFSTAPPNGSAIEVMCARTVVFSAGTPDDNTVSTAKIQDDAVTSAKVDGTVATVVGTETLTNKTLTAPTVNGGTHTTFTSTGIDDNATSTAITIDASENVALAGAISIAGGIGELSAPSANDLAIYGTASGHTGIRFHDVGILPTNNAGAITNGDCDIGIGTHRFKDLYLSGGVYVGGTGAANKLDDYEEGSFTATLTGTTAPSSAQTQTCYYTKIGNLVSVFIRFTNKNTTGASGGMSITGLPFTSSSAAGASNNASVPMLHNLTISDKYVTGYVDASSTVVNFLNIRTNATWTSTQINATTSVYLNMNVTYQSA
jgi:hypothetical protein